MAYLKTHYYKEFMAVLMSYSIGRVNALKNYIFECAKNNIEVMSKCCPMDGVSKRESMKDLIWNLQKDIPNFLSESSFSYIYLL